MPSKASGSATPTSKVSPASTARRALRARTRSSIKGNSRRLSSETRRSPTRPAPTTATVYPSRISDVPFVVGDLVGYVEQVEDDAARGAFRAGAGTAYGEGNIRVAARAEVEDVLGAADRAERALDGLVNQPDLDRPLLRDAGQVAEHVVLLHREQPLGERLVVLGQTLHELLERDVFETFGDEGLVGDLLRLYLPAHLAGED